MKKMSRFLLTSIFLCGFCVLARPANDKKTDEDRLQSSGEVMQQILGILDEIPHTILEHARCVIVMPSVVKAAFIVGGTYGHGGMVCRTGKNFDGPWGSPAMYTMGGGSVGLQIGGEATDFIILVMSDNAVHSLLSNKMKLGANASIAAGPGRTAEMDTAALSDAELLSYSRARGVFAGVSLEGASLAPDDAANRRLYGKDVTPSKILSGPASDAPSAAKTLIVTLDKTAPQLSR